MTFSQITATSIKAAIDFKNNVERIAHLNLVKLN